MGRSVMEIAQEIDHSEHESQRGMNVPASLLIIMSLLTLLAAGAFFLHRSGILKTLLTMSAKLACSAHHISGFSAKRIHRDLQSYSPLFRLVSIEQRADGTSATLANLVTVRAHYHPQLGSRLRKPLPNFTHGDLLGGVATTVRPGHHNYATTEGLQPLTALLREQIQRDHALGLETRALLVIQGADVLGEAYGAGVSAETRLLGWSMTKSVLAMLYGRMEALGLADPTTVDLFPEWSADGRSEISLQNLLQMCDGLAFDESYRPASNVTRMLFGGISSSRYALLRPLANKPGTHFSYSSGSTNVLARWIHRKLGGTEAALRFWQREFLRPLGMPDAVMELDEDGVFVGSSYGYARARHWARLGALLLNKGGISIGGRSTPLLDRDWVIRATTPNGSHNDPRYGYQLWLNTGGAIPRRYPQLPADSMFMLGNREQKLMIAPSHHAVVVRLGWSAHPYPVEDRFGEILDSLPH